LRRPRRSLEIRHPSLHVRVEIDLTRLGTDSAKWRFRARVKVHAPAERVGARVPPAVVVEAIDAQTCFADVGSSSVHQLALWLTMIDEDFELEGAPELADARYSRPGEAWKPLPATRTPVE
jgi:hypothetical protein